MASIAAVPLAADKFLVVYNTPDLYVIYISVEDIWYLPYIWWMMHHIATPHLSIISFGLASAAARHQ